MQSSPVPDLPGKEGLNETEYLWGVGGIDWILIAVHIFIPQVESGDHQVRKHNLFKISRVIFNSVSNGKSEVNRTLSL
jgi:hypothetical protein